MLNRQQLSVFRTPAIIALSLLFAFFYAQLLNRALYHYAEHQGGDFFHFYAATVAMSNGQDIYRSGTGGYVYPPLLAFLYLPLAHLRAPFATAVALTFNLPLMLAAIVVGARTVPQRLLNLTDDAPLTPGLIPVIAFLVALLTFGRIKAELAIMQTDVIILAAYIFAIALLDRRPFLAGTLMGFALNIKYYTLPGLIYFLIRRRWNATAGFIVSALFFALLPAARVGLSTDLQYLQIAFGGVLKSVGVQTQQTEAAHVHKIYESLSLSITSGIARMNYPNHQNLTSPLVAGIILLFIALVAVWYRRRNLPLLIWPDSIAQRAWPFRQLVLHEWAGLMIACIAFSPDSNLRHMVLVLFPNIIAATLLLTTHNTRSRALLILALFLQIFALDAVGNLHIQRLTTDFFWSGGQGWGLLIFYGMLLYVGLNELKQTSPQSRGLVASATS
jgi:hypothetical protein